MLVNKNILTELDEVVQGFKWPDKYADFEVPEGYFVQLSEVVLYKITEGREDELPALPDNRGTFSAPEGYFESLPGKVLSKINRENKATSVTRLPRKRRNWSNWAAAAVIAAFVAMGGLLWLTPFHTHDLPQGTFSLNRQLASVSDEAIEQYLINHINSSNVNEVYSNLSEQDLQDALTSGLSTHAIEEYLQNNVSDSLSF